jgi:hypothetical protein
VLTVAFSYNVRYGCMTIPYKTITKSGSLTCSCGEIEKSTNDRAHISIYPIHTYPNDMIATLRTIMRIQIMHMQINSIFSQYSIYNGVSIFSKGQTVSV